MTTKDEKRFYADINNCGDGWIQVTISGAAALDLTEPGIERALSIQLETTTEAAPLAYPRELTNDLRDILAMMMWNTGPIAHVLRASGADIPNKGEIEQAHVLHWLTLLALEHGDRWRDEAEKRIDEIRAALKATGE